MNEKIKTEFHSNVDALCYIKLKNGLELLAEVFESRPAVQGGKSWRLFRPLALNMSYDPEAGMPKIVTFPFISPMITEEESCIVDKADIFFLISNVNDMMKDMYYKNWEALLSEAYIEDEDVDENGNPLMTEEEMESLPTVAEKKADSPTKQENPEPVKEIPTVMFEGKKRTLQ